MNYLPKPSETNINVFLFNYKEFEWWIIINFHLGTKVTFLTEIILKPTKKYFDEFVVWSILINYVASTWLILEGFVMILYNFLIVIYFDIFLWLDILSYRK